MFSLYILYSRTHYQYTYTEMEINICTFYMLQTIELKILFDMIFQLPKILVKRSNVTLFIKGANIWTSIFKYKKCKWIFYSMKKYKLCKLYLYNNIMLLTLFLLVIFALKFDKTLILFNHVTKRIKVTKKYSELTWWFDAREGRKVKS